MTAEETRLVFAEDFSQAGDEVERLRDYVARVERQRDEALTALAAAEIIIKRLAGGK